ncbi:MAG: SDR family NAD(P)-dependent oxidoreductase [Pirellulaceae bacterium]
MDVLQQVSEAPEMMDQHERFKGLVTKVHRAAKRQKRQLKQKQIAADDRQAIEATAIVQQQHVGAQPRIELPGNRLPQKKSPTQPDRLKRARHCYVCKVPFKQLHHFYHQLCPSCAEFNWQKRSQRADLRGRVALVTGGRVKIGYHTVLKLLRDGASVIMTTRFPADAAARYQAESDFSQWHDRLQIHALDLRNIPSVEAFADYLIRTLDSLDILIHNAAQTVKRPLAYYQHLLDAPCNAKAQSLIYNADSQSVLLESRSEYPNELANVDRYFPQGWLDADGQQVDQRPMHSWMLKLDEVAPIEMLEVYLVNAAAPFVLTGRLKPLLCRSPQTRKFVVNVSAMEGQFARDNKTEFHPHTNMAKAAMNMMTRTSASDFAGDGIYMNSVDTGWITDEKPLPIAQRVCEEHGFFPPLDLIDGASRIYDPIASGCDLTTEPWAGQFLKDYQPYAW